MSSPTFSTGPSLADDPDGASAQSASLAGVLAKLLAAQAELDALGEGIAAARLDAVIEAVRTAMQPAGKP